MAWIAEPQSFRYASLRVEIKVRGCGCGAWVCGGTDVWGEVEFFMRKIHFMGWGGFCVWFFVRFCDGVIVVFGGCLGDTWGLWRRRMGMGMGMLGMFVFLMCFCVYQVVFTGVGFWCEISSEWIGGRL